MFLCVKLYGQKRGKLDKRPRGANMVGAEELETFENLESLDRRKWDFKVFSTSFVRHFHSLFHYDCESMLSES